MSRSRISAGASGGYSVNLSFNTSCDQSPCPAGLAVDATKTVSFEELPTLDFGNEVSILAVVITRYQNH